ncbi:hypothetical protein [Klebsiella pneumoniae]|uniref:hypothetical protein n=1 Tax=Klebsiella pneumoniae TaxID=573 RepID=UPI0002BF866F|nr:hypothetical protein [Klebsiella pneumoniae]HDT0647920.1 hypothetical protein [Klebsiella pneumoniae subsp. ozaenae]EKU9002818.1 hypothetical protein [Klebsiella pneumoniae]EKW8556098.1 hypothetical protein [Klebsiella pneumoniae]ELA1329131.1 hypothetical protein [Klebsiella pneumoniae]EMC2595182.1 hypothetical protein [Klebsiella pneumoniae]
MHRTKRAGPNPERAKSEKTLPSHQPVVFLEGVQLVFHDWIVSDEDFSMIKIHTFSPPYFSTNYFHGVNNCDIAYQAGYHHGLSEYKSDDCKNVVFRYKLIVEGIKQQETFETRSMPRVKSMSFTEACALSRELSDSREERLLRASFDGPE